MSSARLIENLYQVSVHGSLSRENEQKLMWIQEFLSMFDFLWNHSGLFMEIIDIPTTKTGVVYGFYNTIYAQFLKHSFDEKKKFKEVLARVHGMSILQFLEIRQFKNTSSAGEYTFHQCNKRPVARIYWTYSLCPHEVFPEYNRMFSMGVLVRKIQKKNIFVRLFQYLTHRNSKQ